MSNEQFVIAMLYTPEFQELGQLTSKVIEGYAGQHGYKVAIGTESLDASRHPAWSKILHVERVLTNNPSCNWALWIDSDAIVVDRSRCLEEFIDDSVDFVVAEDREGPFNTGTMFVRNCPASIQMLRLAYSKTDFIGHRHFEQGAIIQAVRESQNLRTRIVPRRLFNSFADEYQPGDFVFHHAGGSYQQKLERIKAVIARGTL